MSDDRPKFIGVFKAPAATSTKDNKFFGHDTWAVDVNGNLYNLAVSEDYRRFVWMQIRADIYRPEDVFP